METQQITTIDGLKAYLKKSGSSDSQVTSQISKLGDLIVLKTIQELLSQRPPQNKLVGDDEAAEYIRDTFSADEMSQVLEQTTNNVIRDYLAAITS